MATVKLVLYLDWYCRGPTRPDFARSLAVFSIMTLKRYARLRTQIAVPYSDSVRQATRNKEAFALTAIKQAPTVNA